MKEQIRFWQSVFHGGTRERSVLEWKNFRRHPVRAIFLTVFRFFVIATLCLVAAARADWIELKDGTRIDGPILSVTDQHVTIEVPVTPTIRDEKRYPRSEVAKIQRDSEDDVAFAEIATLQIPPTADSVDQYDAMLKSVRLFLQNYGYSKHLPDARKLAAQLEEERKKLSAGEVKIRGQWFSADNFSANRVELGGQLQLAKMNQAAEPSVALSAFEVLEKQYGTSSAYPDAVRLALVKINELRAALTRARADLDRRGREQAEGLQLASIDRRALMEKGIEQERAAIKARYDTLKQSGAKWLPLLSDAKILDEVSKISDDESARLAKIDVATMATAVAATERARSEIKDGKLEEAKTSLAEAEKLWPQHARLPEVRESLKKAEAAKTAADHTQSAQS